MGHICLSHHIAIYACPIPRDSHYNINMDVSHGIPIGMTFLWTSLALAIDVALYDATFVTFHVNLNLPIIQS